MKKKKISSITTLCGLLVLLLPSLSFASEGGFTWVSLLPFWEYLSGLENHTDKIYDFGSLNANAVTHAFLVSILLISVCIYIKFKSPLKVVPSDKVTLGNILEAIIEFVCGLVEENMGSKGRKFLPFVGALFIFILISNFMSLLPGFVPPTANININAGCAIVVFLSYQGIGFKEHGPSYIKHFAGPIWWLAPFMFTIEMIGHLARPFSLSIRLFGNIMGDHKVLEIFSNMVPIVVPVFNLALGTFVSVIQALVFSLLTTIYFSLAIEAGEH